MRMARTRAKSQAVRVRPVWREALGEVVCFDPPDTGTQIKANESYAEVESVKAVSDVIAPLSGEVIEVNEAVSETPELINEDPYDGGWLVKVRLASPDEQSELL